MSNMTAVEWLFKQLWEEPKDKMVWYAILEQAKEMEKQQIIDAHGTKTSKTTHHGIDVYEIKNGQHYYNETYGSKTEG